MEFAINCRQVVKIYRQRGGDQVAALNGVDLAVPAGGVFGLLGPNGAGKTTLIRLLVGVSRRTSGELTVLGADPQRTPHLAREIGWVAQDAERSMYARLTGWENLYYFGRLLGLAPARLKERVECLVSELGLSPQLLDRNFTTYSGGEKQALMLVRALLIAPRLAVLDEPTKGLDVMTARRLRSFVRVYAREKDHTVLVTGHNLAEMEEICQGVAFIDQGRVIVSGPLAEIKEDIAPRSSITMEPLAGPPDLLAILHRLPGVLQVVREEERVRLLTAEPYRCLAEIIEVLPRFHARPRIQCEEAGLEEIFLALVDQRRKEGLAVAAAE